MTVNIVIEFLILHVFAIENIKTTEKRKKWHK